MDENDLQGDEDEEVQTGGGQTPEDLGMSPGTVNPGAEDLGGGGGGGDD